MLKLAPSVVLYPAGESVSPGSALALPQLASGSVFGDGTHPTTRLCAGALDLLCRQNLPESVLDVGCGTGVLARIARARGVQAVAATDIAPDALISAQANAALDDAGLPSIEVSSALPDRLGRSFDLVVANILEGVLISLAPSLSRALAPGGSLLLSGFTRLQIPALLSAFSAQGLSFATESYSDEWALLMFRKLDHRSNASSSFTMH